MTNKRLDSLEDRVTALEFKINHALDSWKEEEADWARDSKKLRAAIGLLTKVRVYLHTLGDEEAWTLAEEIERLVNDDFVLLPS